jgi:hypothetical protein
LMPRHSQDSLHLSDRLETQAGETAAHRSDSYRTDRGGKPLHAARRLTSADPDVRLRFRPWPLPTLQPSDGGLLPSPVRRMTNCPGSTSRWTVYLRIPCVTGARRDE